MKDIRRLICLFLCVVMVAGVMPPTFAEDDNGLTPYQDEYAYLNKDELIEMGDLIEYIPSRATEDYRKWAQADSRWGSILMGSSGITIAAEGCTVTSVTKLIIQSGLRSADSFNVATLATWLNNNSGYQYPNLLYWGKPSACVSGFSNYGDLLGYGTYSSTGYNNQLLSWIRAGYHMTINVNSGGHWIAVDEAKSLATGQVYIMDSLSGSQNADLTLASRYSTFNMIHAYTGGTTPETAPTTPSNASVTTDKSIYALGETVTITPSASGADHFTMRICYGTYGGDTTVYSDFDGFVGNKTYTPTKTGTYIIRVSAVGSSGNFIDAECTFVVEDPSVTVAGLFVPDEIAKGDTPSLSGVVQANFTMNWLYAGIFVGDISQTSERVSVASMQTNPGTNTYELSDFFASVDFANMSEGTYTLTVEGTSACGYFNAYKKVFTVTEPKVTVVGLDMPDEIGKGDTPSLSGVVQANFTMSWLYAGIFVGDISQTSERVSVASMQTHPGSTTYDLSEFLASVDFANMDEGTYTLTVEGSSACGYFNAYRKVFAITEPKVTVVGLDMPDELAKGENLTLSGVVQANFTMSWLYAGIFVGDISQTSERVSLVSMQKHPGSTTYDLSEFLASVDLANMDEGTYTLTVEVNSACGYFNAYIKVFTICETTAVCEHDYVPVVTAPTCTEQGYTTYTCSKCEDSYVDNYVPALEHDYQAAVTNPTCTEQGYTTHTCSRCGDSYVDSYTDALDHNWDDGVLAPAPSCTEGGVKVFTCQRCGTTKTETIGATGHNPGEPAKENEVAATCTIAGSYDLVIRCTTCDAILYTEHFEIAALDHDYQAVVTAPTCIEGGYTTYTCFRCGDSYVADETAALGHDWSEWRPVPMNFCTDPRIEERTCNRCGATESRTLPPDGHTPGEPEKENDLAPTCEVAGGYDMVVYCTVCGAEISREHTDVAALGHDWNEPEYVWADDYSTVTATRTCKNDANHKETETVNTTSEVIKEATYDEEGEIVYTAIFENVAFATRTKAVAIPKLDGPKPYEPCDGGDDCPGNVFTDMPPKGNWAHDAIDWAIVNKITAGTSATTFSPNAGCTRAQVVTFLWRAAGEPEQETTNNPFEDVKEGTWYYKAVLWAAETGVTAGTSASTFSPDATCTRAQIVTFLWRFEGEPASITTNNPFSDVKAGAYYEKAVLWASETGVTAGTSATTFSPDATCTRAQVVTFLYRDIAK